MQLPCSGMKKALIVLAAIGFALVAQAQTEPYPSRVVRIIVPFPPGSTVDILARTIGQGYSDQLKQSFIVENRPGASGNIGTGLAAKSDPDGYTLLIASVNLVVNPMIYPQVPYEPADFAPLGMVATTANVLVVSPEFAAGSARELIALAKANPGKFNYASSGVGTTVHLSAELFSQMAGIKIVHVPYKGPVEMLNDVMSGRVDLTFANLASVLRLVRAGKLKALGVTTAQRHASLPDLPTIQEQGLSGYEAAAWFGLLARAGTPRPVIGRLSEVLVRTLKADETRKRLNDIGIEPATSSPEQFAAQLKDETIKWAEIIRISGAKAN
jgi:tripartite-type tricarboxylate transporter receptor subunit TctC